MEAKKPDDWIHLSVDFYADIAWWQAFLRVWNHRNMMHVVDRHSPPDIVLTTDASGAWGLGLWSSMGPPLVAVTVRFGLDGSTDCSSGAGSHYSSSCGMGGQWQYKSVLVRCDNMAVVQVINALDPTMMHLLQYLYSYCALFSIHLRAEHNLGVHNAIC